MEYPYIGEYIGDNLTLDLVVLFYSSKTGVVIRCCDPNEVGDFSHIWDERSFKNISHKYLIDIKVRIESQEHLEFLYKIAENAGFELPSYITLDDEYTHFAVTYLCANEINSDCLIFNEYKDVIIPLPPKKDRTIEEALAELIDESLYATVDMDDILKIAKVIIKGDVKGLEYKPE